MAEKMVHVFPTLERRIILETIRDEIEFNSGREWQ